jgi:hypothetical protein
MSSIEPVDRRGIMPWAKPAATGSAAGRVDPEPQANVERVEFSDAAQAGLADDPTIEQRIPEIRAAIAAGTYLTPEKLEIAIERLCEDVRRT